MRGTRLRSSVGLLTLCVGVVALFDCTLDTDGAFIDPGPQGTGGTGFEGSGGSGVEGGSSGTGGAGVGGSETGGSGGGSTGASGGGSGGSAGGDSGSAGAGQGGGGSGGVGGGGPTLPNVLGCKAWLPDNAKWEFKGDARYDAVSNRIVLTPADGKNHWGQAYLDIDIDPDDRIDIAFTFVFESGTSDFAEGAAAWFTQGSSVNGPPGGVAQAHLGVPAADVGGVLVLDMNDTVPPVGGPFWAMYPSEPGGSTLGLNVAEQNANGVGRVADGLVPQGPHTATVRMLRGSSNRLDMTANIVGLSGPELALSEDNAGEVFDGGRVGFSAGSVAGGAVHALLGIEIDIDQVCFNPP